MTRIGYLDPVRPEDLTLGVQVEFERTDKMRVTRTMTGRVAGPLLALGMYSDRLTHVPVDVDGGGRTEVVIRNLRVPVEQHAVSA